jgi:hypothetical protein
MLRSIAVTGRFPGARTAPVRTTFPGCQTGRDKTGAKTPMTRLQVIGKASLAVLAGAANTGCHGRSMMTQLSSMDKLELRKVCYHASKFPPFSVEAKSALER